MEINTPYKLYKTDPKAESETGIILDFGDYKIRIARAGGKNKKFERLFKARFEPYQRQLKAGTMSNETALDLMVNLYADAVILSWESKDSEGNFVDGIHDENGEIIPTNRENIVKTLLALPDQFKEVQDAADKLSLWRIETLEEKTKNSSAV